tara:strand:- start:13 stop:192 length:180 start_codon:yes stop_codon:yes gene_type:complete
MEFKDAKYIKDPIMNDKIDVVSVSLNGDVIHVPMDKNNMHYAEILKQVEAKTLTIADAD